MLDPVKEEEFECGDHVFYNSSDFRFKKKGQDCRKHVNIFFSNPVLICSEGDQLLFFGECHSHGLSDKADELLEGALKCTMLTDWRWPAWSYFDGLDNSSDSRFIINAAG